MSKADEVLGSITPSRVMRGTATVRSRRFLVFVRSNRGGIAKYATEQARELARREYEVMVLSTRALGLKPSPTLRVIPCLFDAPLSIRAKLLRRLLFVLLILLNQAILVTIILWHKPDVVLFDAYSEIMAPLWSWPHVVLNRVLGVQYVVTIHDPERVRQFGPQWWHDLSVWTSYLPFTVGLVHGLASLKREWIPRKLPLTEVPHGVFGVDADALPEQQPSGIRDKLGIPSSAPVALAFGYVADRKNLDLTIRALARCQKLHLIVAGSRASSTDRPIAYYQNLARDLRVSERVHLIDEYVPDSEIGRFFSAADIVLLTYKSEFVSQSGVLHVAANWGKPVLASSGPGPLSETVEKYRLGITVEPDSLDALASGLARLLAGEGPPFGWERFRRDASWATNIDRFLAALENVR